LADRRLSADGKSLRLTALNFDGLLEKALQENNNFDNGNRFLVEKVTIVVTNCSATAKRLLLNEKS